MSNEANEKIIRADWLNDQLFCRDFSPREDAMCYSLASHKDDQVAQTLDELLPDAWAWRGFRMNVVLEDGDVRGVVPYLGYTEGDKTARVVLPYEGDEPHDDVDASASAQGLAWLVAGLQGVQQVDVIVVDMARPVPEALTGHYFRREKSTYPRFAKAVAMVRNDEIPPQRWVGPQCESCEFVTKCPAVTSMFAHVGQDVAPLPVPPAIANKNKIGELSDEDLAVARYWAMTFKALVTPIYEETARRAKSNRSKIVEAVLPGKTIRWKLFKRWSKSHVKTDLTELLKVCDPLLTTDDILGVAKITHRDLQELIYEKLRRQALDTGRDHKQSAVKPLVEKVMARLVKDGVVEASKETTEVRLEEQVQKRGRTRRFASRNYRRK